MKSVLQLYKNAYGGLSQAAWLLSLIMLINRAGSMVVPFLSVYLTNELQFSIEDAGILLSLFGAGSMAGSYMGGWLTDRIGQFRVQLLSLILGGLMFLVLGLISSFALLAVWLFLVSLISDSLRPANAASISLYARPENVTRAFSLNRMAVNLGFSIGPAVGGLLAAVSYHYLFLVDGITCMAAGVLFYFGFRKRKTYSPNKNKDSDSAAPAVSVWKDTRFLMFAFCCMMFAIIFFQLFFTLPLYYRDVYHLSESMIGLLLGLNGLIVFLVEMVLVYLVGNKIPPRTLIAGGTLLAGFSFVLLNLFAGMWILFIAMILLSFSEILAMPYMVTHTVNQSGEKTRGAYMGMYALSYATAFVIAPFFGTRIIASLGFEWLWWLTGVIAVAGTAGFTAVLRKRTSVSTAAHN
jgi:predicted MFS family arabinose efflux permease